MSRISPSDLPQPIYPVGPPTTGPIPVVGSATATKQIHVAIPAPAPAPLATPRKPAVPKAAIWGGAAAAMAVVAVVVAVLVLTGGKAGPGPGPSTTSPPGGDHASAETSSAVNKLVGGALLTNAEYSCLFNDLDSRPELVAAVQAGSYDTSEAAGVIAGCVSPQTIADLLDVAFQSAGVDSVTAECIRTEIADMTESSLTTTVEALLDGDSDSLGQVLATEAAYCFPSS